MLHMPTLCPCIGDTVSAKEASGHRYSDARDFGTPPKSSVRNAGVLSSQRERRSRLADGRPCITSRRRVAPAGLSVCLLLA